MKKDETRVYVVPLRKEFLKAPRWRRSKKAMAALKEFLLKHTKADKLVVSRWVNEEIWKHGGKNSPSKLKVKVTLKEEEKEVKGTTKKEKIRSAHIELDTLPPRAARVAKKAEKKKSLREKLKEKFAKTEAPEETEDKEDKKAKKEEKKKSTVTKAQELKMNK